MHALLAYVERHLGLTAGQAILTFVVFLVFGLIVGFRRRGQ